MALQLNAAGETPARPPPLLRVCPAMLATSS